jgi:sulfur carrier protein
MIRLQVNGEPRELAATSVAEALGALAIPPDARGLAVALNGALVTRVRWAATPLVAGDRLEIVRAVSGG